MSGGSGAAGRSKTSDMTSAATPATTQKVDLGDLVEYKNPDGTAALVLTPDNTASTTTTTDTTSQSGGRRKHRHTKNCRHSRKTQRRSKRGGMGLGEAILPFGLFGLQKLFQKRRSSKAKKH
jgi:uncharacterized protein YndB with AHSA1/START domain